jgi:hypothetical protein
VLNSGLLSRFLLATALLTLSSCGNIALMMVSGNGTEIDGLNATGDGASFAERCGAKASQLSDPSFIVIDQKLQSTPIVVKSTRGGINVEVTLQGNLQVRATAGLSTQETNVKVVKLVADDQTPDHPEGLFSKAEAEKAAAENSQRLTSWGMSSGLLLLLQKSDPNFKNVLCSVGFTSKQKVESITGNGLITFEPGLPTSVNPKASAATLASELGDSRSFSATATIKQAAKDWAGAGTSAKVTVTFRKISPDPKSVNGMPTNAPAINPDLAYEATTVVEGHDAKKFGLSRRQVFFINTSERRLVGALDDSGQLNPADKKELPPNFAYPVGD